MSTRPDESKKKAEKDLSVDSKQDRSIPPQDPCTIVIFGASGDLTARKLLPALFKLYLNKSLPESYSIVGCSRTSMTDQEFRGNLQTSCTKTGCIDQSQWDDFASRLYYRTVTYDSQQSFHELAAFLNDLDNRQHTKGNRIFYLAIPPTLYPVVAEGIGQSGLAAEGENNNGWARIVVEKPFGHNLTSALELDSVLHRSFGEHQIFRIDHYLAKETVQNILMLRFANAIFEPLWNMKYIDYIGIMASEKLGIEHRAGYYEQAGVLRDMFQNHMMQLLALTAMEPPAFFEADRVRDEKVKVYRSLRPFLKDRIEKQLVLGQYTAGVIDDTEVPGYLQEAGVAPASPTPTFAIMRLFIDNWRWQGVPFYLVSGKRLQKKITRIVVQFKEVPHSMFRNILGEHITANRLLLGVFPEEEITLTFQAKQPGPQDLLQSVVMDFKYNESFTGPSMEAYEKVLLDCIEGDHMLFWRQDGVELCWSFLSPILEECEKCAAQAAEIHQYKSGSWGPEAAQDWVSLLLN